MQTILLCRPTDSQRNVTSASSELNPWVAKLVKSFEALYEITESLHDFRYEPIYVFSFEDALALFFF